MSRPKTQPRKAAKSRARALLRGHSGTAALLLVLGGVLAGGAGVSILWCDHAALQVVSSLSLPDTAQTHADDLSQILSTLLLLGLFLLVSSPFQLGREAWFSGAAAGRRYTVKRILFWLQPRFALKAIAMRLMLCVRKCLWALLFFSPGGILTVGLLLQMRTAPIDFWLLVCALSGGVVLFVVGLGFYAVTVQRYALVRTILTNTPRVKLRIALRQSIQRTEGHSQALLGVHLSFLPCLLLSCLGLPALVLLPYRAQTLSCYHQSLLKPLSSNQK